MGGIIAIINVKSIYLEDDIFKDEEEKELYLNSSDEQKREFIKNLYFSNLDMFNEKVSIDLYE